MVFSSLTFICVFLPIVFIIYYLIPFNPVKNALLILASLIFYAYGEPIYVLLLITSAFANYVFGLLVSKQGIIKKTGIIIAVIANILVLCLFKYTGFITDTFGLNFFKETPFYDIALPIGISFFTFQALSYVIDVYRGVVSKQTNFFKLLLYISFFPQLIAGPIVKYKDVENQLSVRKPDVSSVSYGIQRFIFGLGKKVLLANTFAVVADNIFSASMSEINILGAWIGAVAYTLQIFFDFSGYSDMAIGMASMFGFNFMENFNDPYVALGIQDFWRRWHISLSTWFKEYLYIPLGGNRKSAVRTDINKIIVFLCTGIWHGANITFVFWGIYNGLFLLLESHVKKIKQLNKWVLHIYTMLVVCVGFVFFRADTFLEGICIIVKMFTGFTFYGASLSLALQQLTPKFLITFVVAIAVILRKKFSKLFNIEIFRMLFSILILIACMLTLSTDVYNPFIYFRF